MNQNIIIVDNFIDGIETISFKEVIDEVPKRISQILNEKVLIKSFSTDKEVSRGVVSDNNSKWTGVHFLDDPLSLNAKKLVLKFFSHKETGLEYCPNESMRKQYDASNEINLWNQYANIQAKYNKLVLFRSDLWHSFGNDLSVRFTMFRLQ